MKVDWEGGGGGGGLERQKAGSVEKVEKFTLSVCCFLFVIILELIKVFSSLLIYLFFLQVQLRQSRRNLFVHESHFRAERNIRDVCRALCGSGTVRILLAKHRNGRFWWYKLHFMFWALSRVAWSVLLCTLIKSIGGLGARNKMTNRSMYYFEHLPQEASSSTVPFFFLLIFSHDVSEDRHAKRVDTRSKHSAQSLLTSVRGVDGGQS